MASSGANLCGGAFLFHRSALVYILLPLAHRLKRVVAAAAVVVVVVVVNHVMTCPIFVKWLRDAQFWEVQNRCQQVSIAKVF